MKEHIELIFCYRDRDPESLRASMASLAKQNDQGFKVTLVDYGSDEIHAKAAREICKQHDFCSYFYINARGKMWNRSDALNHGILLSRAEDLFFADIDMIFFPDFVEQLNVLRADRKAHFFSVGYLSAQATKKARKGNFTSVAYKKSEAFAAGMLLVSRKILNAVNGYNSFFSLWGLEDNDLKRRIELAGFKTNHVQKVLMLHQYHRPVPESNQLPEGWIQFMKDQFLAQTGQINTAGITQSLTLGGRPAEENFRSGKLQYREIKGRKLFLRHVLMNNICKPGVHAFAIKPVEPENPGLVQRHAKQLSQIARFFGLHVDVRSRYHEQYLSEKEIMDEIHFLIRSLSNRIADYYIHLQPGLVQLVVISR